MGKFGKQLQKTLHKVQHKFAHHNSVKLEDEDIVVYVGDEMRRFVIKTKIFNHHRFQMLLTKSIEEFGYNPAEHHLILDCDVPSFKILVRSIKKNRLSNRLGVWIGRKIL